MAIGDPQAELQRVASNPGPAPGGGASSPPPPEPGQVRLPADPWSDTLAKGVVVNDFLRAQAHRSKNFDPRWDENDRLYHANVPQRYWEGTDVPRSSIGVKLVWQQLEAVLPRVLEAMFNAVDGIWFDCFPLPGTKPEQALANRELQAYQLDAGSFKEVFRRTVKSAGQHGMGVLKMAWHRSKCERMVWLDAEVPQTMNVMGFEIATGTKRVFKRQKYTQKINRPQFSYIPLRDFYIDPSHKHPWIDIPGQPAAKFVIQRAMMTLDELAQLKKDDPSYKGIDESRLKLRAAERMAPAKADADTHKQIAAQEAGIFQSYPASGSSDPAKFPFEVLEYWTRDRLVTVVDREIIARNIPNPFGFIPYFAVPFTDVLDEFYGKGLAEILEGEQRIQQGIINARLDELALNIHGQLVYQEGMVIGKHQLRPRPGGAIGVTGDVAQAIKRLERQEMTGSAFAEVSQSQLRAEQYTGISGMVVQGAPSVPTSASRTKHGVSTMASAAFSRIQYLVENIANTVIIPMLNRLQQLNERYLDPEEAIRILGPSLGQEIKINPLAITNGQFRFEMRAASRMAAKAAMQQSLPFILQTILNPALMQALAGEGIVPNVQAIVRDTLDVLGWRSRNDWFRELSQEEMQARQQQQLTPEVMKLMKEQMRLEAKTQQIDQKETYELVKLGLDRALEQAPGAASQALAGALQEL